MARISCNDAVAKERNLWACLACGKKYTKKPPGGRCRSLEALNTKRGISFFGGNPERGLL